MTDGNLTLTTISSEVLGSLYMTLHETKNREGSAGEPVNPGRLNSTELDLYEIVSSEIKARLIETSRNRKPSVLSYRCEGVEHNGKDWVILFEEMSTPPANAAPFLHSGTKQSAMEVAKIYAETYGAKRFFVSPWIPAAEGRR